MYWNIKDDTRDYLYMIETRFTGKKKYITRLRLSEQ